MKTKKQIKAEKGFDFACRQASKCRHLFYQVSCYSCPKLEGCEIQQRLERHRKNMK